MDCQQRVTVLPSSTFAGVKANAPAGTQAFLTKVGAVVRELTVSARSSLSHRVVLG